MTVAALMLPMGTIFAQTGESKRAEWRFFKSNDSAEQNFTATGTYRSFCGEPSEIRFVSKKGRKSGCEYSMKSGMPIVKNASAGDYWLFEMPVENLAAGTVVDFWTAFTAEPNDTPRKFMLEYCDGGKWKPASAVSKADGVTYNCTSAAKPKAKSPRYLWTAVKLSKPIKKGAVRFRLMQTEKSQGNTALYGGASGLSPRIICYDNIEPRDTLRILFLGNSYTYYNLYPIIFKEIAWREGHYADCSMFVSGGYTMKAHLANSVSREAVSAGNYDCAMIQDQSITPTMNGTEDDFGQKKHLCEMVSFIRESSPTVKPFVEITWGRKRGNNNLGKYKPLAEKYPQYFSDYDAMQSRLIETVGESAKAAGAEITPVGIAWQTVRRERPDIELYAKDAHHPSYAGSYLSAAVAYLTVYRTPFGKNPTYGKLDSDTAAYLRDVAHRVVLGNAE